MLQALSNRNYRLLFLAQIVALLGTGLLTVALGLIAYDLKPDRAGEVLATALVIKMLVYIIISPLAEAVTDRFNRKTVLISADLIRCVAAICMPFLSAEWHIYLVIFILQTASATFTPTFQAMIPVILPSEKEYTDALSLSRLAYDLENIVSPLIAAILLSVLSFHWLFTGTAVGFFLSSALIFVTSLPEFKVDKEGSFVNRLFLGARVYLSTSALRGLLCLNFVAACFGSMVIVNSVVLIKTELNGTDTRLAVTLAAFGAGSMIAALALPRFLKIYSDRQMMIGAAWCLIVLLLFYGVYLGASGDNSWYVLLLIWFSGGLGSSIILTPSGRLLNRSSNNRTRPALFAAQFSLSHLCWLITYPIAGYSGKSYGMSLTMLFMCGLSFAAVVLAFIFWDDRADILSEREGEQ